MHGRHHRPPFRPATGDGSVFRDGSFQSQLQHRGSNIPPQLSGVYQHSQNLMNVLAGLNFLNYPHQSPNFPIQQNPNFPIQNHGFTSQNRDELLKTIDSAVAKAHRDTIAAGVSVSAWRVSQSALSILQVDSWSSLGFQMQDVPSLRRIINTEGKINAFIHCFIAVRRITSLYDLEVAICKNEGVDQFEDLELGPLLQHPLVLHNFPVGYGATDVFKITSEEIILLLVEFMDAVKNKEIKIDEFLNFVAKKKSVMNKETLGIRIQSLGMYIQFFREARRQEGAAVKKFLKVLQPKSCSSSSQKEQLDEKFLSIAQRVESFTSLQKDFVGKHIRFDSSSSDDEDDEDTGDYSRDHIKSNSNIGNQFNISRSYIKNSSDHVNSCPYPSAVEEMTRLGLKDKICDHSLPASGGSRRDENSGSSKKKRKYENPSSVVSTSSKLLKKESPSSVTSSRLHKKESMKQDVVTTDDGDKEVCNLDNIDISISDADLKMFISTWKEAFRELTVAEALERMLQYYKQTDNKVPTQERKRMRLMLSSFPFVGLLNVAVQNADDNVYKKSVEPTLVFILQESGIVILNNEEGFSAENIRALCDVGKSTKKGSGGYIGQKGIGFKSVFRVSDAPEIHSNGFHVKFDISEGQIGFVLPTVVPSCNIDIYSKILSQHASQLGQQGWNTCIILPFKSKFSGGVSMNNINAMFSDLHPSLLLFLHRLQCIVFQNLIEDSLIIMKKEVLENGIIKVSSGKDRMTWLVESQKLHVEKNRPDVQTTEIAIAFTLQESDNGKYKPYLSQQPVFSYLPLRTYGLKFILQGDFVLPSSREEVDGDSPWNQWLLLKFPDLFIRAEKSFCALPCFMENPGKGVGAYMSFVPLVGEVHGFFSSLPRIIISKLRVSNCLLMEGDKKQWVPPCKVLRGWNEQARALLTDSLLHEHLGLGLLNKDIVLTDYLSRALGIEDYGPKILVEIIASLSRTKNDLKSIGLGWLASCLNELYTLSFHSTRQASLNLGKEEDLIDRLRNIPFIPLSDGAYGSLIEDTIWLHSDGSEFDGGHGLEAFPKLYAKLRIVNPVFLFASDVDITCRDVNLAGNLIRMLCRIGVQNLSAHEIMKVHILPAVSDEGNRNIDKSLMIEYLCFVMMHLDSGCPDCRSQKEHIFRELKDKTFILTNYGFKKTTETPIHFGEEFGNCINVYKLIDEADMKWHEVSMDYLKHPASKAHAYGVKKWREFFQEIGVTDFVQVVQVDKSVVNLSSTDLKIIKGDMNLISPGLVVKDWESLELVQLLSSLSQRGNKEGCKYLLEVLDMLWHDCFSDKTTIDCNSLSVCGDRLINSSFVCNIRDICWVVSSMDDKLHCAKDLFYDCDEVRSILGTAAPYAVPKVRNEKLINAAGFKTKVTIDDILEIQDIWRMSPTPFRASISQMTRFYRFIWNEISTSKQRIIEKFHSSPSIFVPCESGIRHEDVVSGVFLSVGEVCWHDSTGSINQLKEIHRQCGLIAEPLCSKTLCDVYPGFHDFFVKECSVLEMPSFRGYLRIVLELSRNTLPSCAASSVFRVFLKWADGLKSGQCSEDILYLKDCLTKLEFTVLPTEQDKWVSLHHSFGLVCWSDDEKLKKIFRRKDNIDFLNFGKLSDEEQEVLQSKILDLMHALDIPVLSEVVTREAIYEGRTDSCFKMSLVNWALPYAQRYFYTLHPDKYLKLKQSGFNNLNQLQIVAVEKLYYRNIINRCGAASRKQVECNCLLQDNILYTTPDSDFHSLFMEFSRLLFDGTPDLHMANLLHMVTTMAETGSNREQMESFILNGQKLKKLPDDESVWSLSSASMLAESNVATVINEENSLESLTGGTNSNWPPLEWKTVPGCSSIEGNVFQTQSFIPQPNSSKEKENREDLKGLDAQNIVVPIEVGTNLAVKDDSGTTSATTPASEGVRKKFGHTRNQSNPSVKIAISSFNLDCVSSESEFSSLDSGNRAQLSTSAPNSMQAWVTGRMGEEVAFRYITSHFADRVVKWVNEYNESGLPYDIVIGEKEEDKRYFEVKATTSARKDWFYMSVREWQFAAEKGDSFVIAHVLLGNQQAELKFHPNPVKRCQEGSLRLVIMMPKHQ